MSPDRKERGKRRVPEGISWYRDENKRAGIEIWAVISGYISGRAVSR